MALPVSVTFHERDVATRASAGPQHTQALITRRNRSAGPVIALEVAITEALADEVTPPLTAGNAWTPIRIAWLRDFHRGRRGGLDGLAREATWATLSSNR